MPLDNTNFPFVWMSYDEAPDHDHDEDFAALEASFKRGTPFVILTDSAPTEDHEHSHEEKKRTALWMKKHKAELRALVLAMIVIEASATKRLAFKSFGVAFAKFWGYPLKLAASREEAMEIAGNLLSERAWSPKT
ncbi:ABC-type Zn2+ transport system substrate-binding protein/surface adhesin [Amorphus suaedae]